MFVRPGDLDNTVHIVRKNINDIFDRLLDNPTRFKKWTTQYFEEQEEDFQATILALIGKYYRKDIKEHSVLKTGLRLLWYEYLLLNKFTIPQTAVAEFETKLEATRPSGTPKDIEVIPDTINRFLKAIILPMAEKAAEELTTTLHGTLFKMAVTPKSSRGHNDLVLCMLFILMIFLGRTQNALHLLAGTPASEVGIDYSPEDAEAKSQEMERKVTDYFLDFHKYTLSKMSSRPPVTPSEISSPLELHARKSDLLGELRREIEEEYGKLDACSSDRLWSDKAAASERPDNLELGGLQMDASNFWYMTVRRLCWKVCANVEDD